MARSHSRSRGSPQSGGLWLYGVHAVKAALANPSRTKRRCVLTSRAAEAIGTALLSQVAIETADAERIARLVPSGAVHQGVAMQCEPLPRRDLEEVLDPATRQAILVLDQVADPHNVGAILRSAAAFEAAAVIVQDRHAPPESGTLAKAASGGLDLVPYITVVNIARALEQLGNAGFWRVALSGEGEQPLAPAVAGGSIAFVLGSEGSGLRRLVRARCDSSAFIAVGQRMDSLNVSNAAAIALYEWRRHVDEPDATSIPE